MGNVIILKHTLSYHGSENILIQSIKPHLWHQLKMIIKRACIQQVPNMTSVKICLCPTVRSNIYGFRFPGLNTLPGLAANTNCRTQATTRKRSRAVKPVPRHYRAIGRQQLQLFWAQQGVNSDLGLPAVRGRRVLRQQRGAAMGTQSEGSEPGGAAGHGHGPGAAGAGHSRGNSALRLRNCWNHRRPPATGSRQRCPPAAGSVRTLGLSGETERLARSPAIAHRHPTTFGRSERRVPLSRSRPPAPRGCRRAGPGWGSVPQGRPGTRPALSSPSLVPPRGRSGPPGRARVRQWRSAPGSPDAPSAPGWGRGTAPRSTGRTWGPPWPQLPAALTAPPEPNTAGRAPPSFRRAALTAAERPHHRERAGTERRRSRAGPAGAGLAPGRERGGPGPAPPSRPPPARRAWERSEHAGPLAPCPAPPRAPAPGSGSAPRAMATPGATAPRAALCAPISW